MFHCEGKILLTLFGDNVFHLATVKNISVVSLHLCKSYFGPWVSYNFVQLTWGFRQIDNSLSLETWHKIFFLYAVSTKPSRSQAKSKNKAVIKTWFQSTQIVMLFKAVEERRFFTRKAWEDSALACTAGVFWTRECTFSYLGRHLGFDNCGGLGRGNIFRGSRR